MIRRTSALSSYSDWPRERSRKMRAKTLDRAKAIATVFAHGFSKYVAWVFFPNNAGRVVHRAGPALLSSCRVAVPPKPPAAAASDRPFNNPKEYDSWFDPLRPFASMTPMSSSSTCAPARGPAARSPSSASRHPRTPMMAGPETLHLYSDATSASSPAASRTRSTRQAIACCFAQGFSLYVRTGTFPNNGGRVRV